MVELDIQNIEDVVDALAVICRWCKEEHFTCVMLVDEGERVHAAIAGTKLKIIDTLAATADHLNIEAELTGCLLAKVTLNIDESDVEPKEVH